MRFRRGIKQLSAFTEGFGLTLTFVVKALPRFSVYLVL